MRLHVKYTGTDTALPVSLGNPGDIRSEFEASHHQQYGFLMPDKDLTIETLDVEVISKTDRQVESDTTTEAANGDAGPVSIVQTYMAGHTHETQIFDRNELAPGQEIRGPAIIREPVSTVVVEPGWLARVRASSDLVLTRTEPLPGHVDIGAGVDPIMLEVFNNLFMSIAEQMGSTLQNTAYSTNIKERLDFSCAIFDITGSIIANAPHIPVHLGSMSDSVRAIMRERQGTMNTGDVFVLNDPYQGGTHLPDVTVITPVFLTGQSVPAFYVASRAHHADIGGVTPGSMPPGSTTISEEGILIRNFQLVDSDRFREQEMREVLGSGLWPARNSDQNIADLKAQIAANNMGVQELLKMVGQYGRDVVKAYMRHIQDYAEQQTRKAIGKLSDSEYVATMDDGAEIHVRIKIEPGTCEAAIDFTGTSEQQDSNFNAPLSVTHAAVMYVFRTLLDVDIPLNEGCFKPLDIIIPEGSMLNPRYPAAVVAGNVEISMCICDALYGALGILAGSQGTMNNLTFGNDQHQHYETLCGGSPAGNGFTGTSAVHTHMTNSRLTDAEILETRFPVRLERFEIRKGSGGGGEWRGGDGTVREISFLEPMTVALLANRHEIPPAGLAGGEAAKTGEAQVCRSNGETFKLRARDQADLEAGDSVVIKTPGGGGFGKA